MGISKRNQIHDRANSAGCKSRCAKKKAWESSLKNENRLFTGARSLAKIILCTPRSTATTRAERTKKENKTLQPGPSASTGVVSAPPHSIATQQNSDSCVSRTYLFSRPDSLNCHSQDVCGQLTSRKQLPSLVQCKAASTTNVAKRLTRKNRGKSQEDRGPKKADAKKTAKPKSQQQISSEAVATIQWNREAIQILKREIDHLEQKAASNLLAYNLLYKEGYTGIVSETLWQIKSMVIRHRHSRLSRKIGKLSDEVERRRKVIEDLLPEPSLFRRKSKVPIHHLLPLCLYSIQEETEQDMSHYENGDYENPEQPEFIFDLDEEGTGHRHHWKLLFGRL